MHPPKMNAENQTERSGGLHGAACCVSFLAEYRASAKSKRKARPLFDHLLMLGRREARPLPAARKVRHAQGCSALEWLVANESQGKDLSTRHPLIVEKIIIGRWIKGLTKDMWIEDLRDRLITPAEVREWAYSAADAQDVINRARSLHNVLAHPRREGSLKIKQGRYRRRMERLVLRSSSRV
jgi:hypothetical protein